MSRCGSTTAAVRRMPRRRPDTTRARGNSDKTAGGSCVRIRATMAKYTRGEFLGFGAALAGAFTLGTRGRRSSSAVAQRSRPAPSAGGEPDLDRRQRARCYTSDAALPRAEAFAVKNGRFTAVGSTSDVRNLATARTPVIDAQQMTVIARLHRRAQPPERRRGAVRRQHQPPHRARDSGGDPQEGETHAARVLGHRLHVRRHQARSAADAEGSRRSDDRAPGVGGAPRRPHELLQQQGVRAGRHHRADARSRRRPVLQGERRAERPRRRERAQRVRPRRQARDLHARAAPRPRAQRHARTCRSCSTPPASRRCTTPAPVAGPHPRLRGLPQARRADAPRLHDDPRRRRPTTASRRPTSTPASATNGSASAA